MAFTPFDFDVKVHSQLGDDPNVDNNMTADELKALFDSPMVAFKTWINEVLIPALDSFAPESSIAVFIQSEKPAYSPCIWFRPLPGGASEMSYVDKSGKQTVINMAVDEASIMDGAVSSDKIGRNAVTPEKLDRSYFESEMPIILKEGVHYGDSLPAVGQKGRLFFKKVTE